MNQTELDQLSINTIRTLCMDAVQQANSGHPGTPMGMAPLVYVLWQEFLRYDPAHPHWANRDRFVLSAGHASTLLYSILHLTGVKELNHQQEPTGGLAVKLEDLQRFRQLDSKCPGHPEFRWTTGVEITTGPLGQGVASSVGMAMAAAWQAQHFNRPGTALFDFDVYALAGDGCMMEGISGEAASLAGHLRLGNLCWIYDSNRITIEGSTSIAFSEDVGARFAAYGWHVIRVADANDLPALRAALQQFRSWHDRPTLIIIESHIGFGAPTKQDKASAHGEPLGENEIRGAKKNYGWPEDAKFLVPAEVPANFQAGIGARGAQLYAAWSALLAQFTTVEPAAAETIARMQRQELPLGWDKDLPVFPADPKGMAGREASGKVLNAVAKNYPWLIGGSADLAPSTKTWLTFEGAGTMTAATLGGRNLHFGVREHAMGAILNGLAVSNLRPYGAGFLVFSDYGRTPIRLAAMMEIPVIYVFTHDSIGVGEDGPTHQPIEQVMSLRAVPGLIVLRPGDANEVTEAWRVVCGLRHETALFILSRQAMPTLDRTKFASAAGVARGGYILSEPANGQAQVILIGTGTELSLCVDAQAALAQRGIAARVVSLPSWELFERQDAAYREAVLPRHISARVAVEQGTTLGWERYVGLDGVTVGMKTFGASAPMKDLQKRFGFTVDHVVAAAVAQVEKARPA